MGKFADARGRGSAGKRELSRQSAQRDSPQLPSVDDRDLPGRDVLRIAISMPSFFNLFHRKRRNDGELPLKNGRFSIETRPIVLQFEVWLPQDGSKRKRPELRFCVADADLVLREPVRLPQENLRHKVTSLVLSSLFSSLFSVRSDLILDGKWLILLGLIIGRKWLTRRTRMDEAMPEARTSTDEAMPERPSGFGYYNDADVRFSIDSCLVWPILD